MPGSLDELVQFLLDEIALSGQQGSTVRDVLGFVDRFYKASIGDTAWIDSAFQEQVWKWLTDHPEICVGKDGKDNKMSLFTAGTRYTSALPATDSADILDSYRHRLEPSVDLDQDSIHPKVSHPGPSDMSKGLKVFVTEERMWLAICGHPKDLSKIFDKEFELLSLIAANRSSGVLQAELVRQSGQDKRSVPKRTDALRDKGYIEKRATHIKGQKTSRLVLLKFASENADKADGQVPALAGSSIWSQDESIDFPSLIHNLFSTLVHRQIITLADMRSELEMTTRWQKRILSKVVRRFERIGCLKRVKAASEATKIARYHFNCVKLCFEPSDQDLESFYSSGPVSVKSHAVEEQDVEGDEDDGGGSPAIDPDLDILHAKPLEEISRLIPQWNPDRALPNTLHDLIEGAGTQGLTNKEIRTRTFGLSLRRPLENLLSRFTSEWFRSQPPFLQHLSILRDTVLSGTSPLYVHYSFANFKTRVESGKTFWEAVRAPDANHTGRGKKDQSTEMPPNSADLPLDDFGFPANYRLLRHHDVQSTLGQAVLAVRSRDLHINNRDPIIWQTSSGAFAIRYDGDVSRTQSTAILSRHVPITSPTVTRMDSAKGQRNPSQTHDTRHKPLGRPRKFLQGSEKFWRDQFAMSQARGKSQDCSLKRLKRGTMSHPTGLTLFAERPPQFDFTLVQAMENGMPVPAKPQEITQEWVDSTLAVLRRSASGLYITPKGTKSHNLGKSRATSRVFIFRSLRLRELHLRNRVCAVRFLVSSAAHTFSYPQYLSSQGNETGLSTSSSESHRGRTPILTSGHISMQEIALRCPGSDEILSLEGKRRVSVQEVRPILLKRTRKKEDVTKNSQRDACKSGSSASETLLPAETSSSHANRVGQGPTYAATAHKSDVGKYDSLNSLGEAAPESRTQVLSHIEPGAETPEQSPSQSSAAVEVAINHSEKVSETRTNLDSVDDTTSQMLRLVEELTEHENTPLQQETGAEDTITNLQGKNNKEHGTNNLSGLPELTVVDTLLDEGPPRKRVRSEGPGLGSVSILRRKILLEFVERCGGAMPHYSFQAPLCAAFRAAWRKANQAGKPDTRTVQATVKSLCQSGSLKQIKFSFRNEKGVMVTNTILANSELSSSSQVIVETQKNMIEADPRPYFPNVLEMGVGQTGEVADPIRDTKRPTRGRWPDTFEEQTVETSSTPVFVLRQQLRATLHRARQRRNSAKAAAQRAGGQIDQQEQMEGGYRQRLAGGKRKYGKQSEVYKRPSLRRAGYRQPLPEPSSQSSHETSNGPGARTESSQPALAVEPVGRPIDSPTLDSTMAQKNQSQSTPMVQKKSGYGSTLPTSTEDILMAVSRSKRADRDGCGDSDYRSFEWTVNRIAEWERKSPNLADAKSEDWKFINLAPGSRFQAVREIENSEEAVTFDGLIWFDERGRERTEKRFHDPERSSPILTDTNPKLALGQEPDEFSRRSARKLLDSQRPSRKRKRDPVAGLGPITRRAGAKSPLTRPQMITDSAGNPVDVSHLIGARYRRPRGTQHLRGMPEHLVYKFTVTVVALRALAGGLDKHVDWSLVMCVFPDEDEQFLRDRWRTLSSKYRREINQLMDNFQIKFLDAYSTGDVPPIDFGDLESVDWEGLVQWALENLDKPIMQEMEDLPATRAEFDEAINMKTEDLPRHYGDCFAYNQPITLPVKEEAICAIPFAVCPFPPAFFPSNHEPPVRADAEPQSEVSSTLAESWALATIATPLDDFDAAKAHRKLRSLATTPEESEEIIESAIQSLHSNKAIIKKRDRGVDTKGRSYNLSRVLTDKLDHRQSINAMMLSQAARYKVEVLDPAFRKDKLVKFLPVAVEDGDMVAILNLAANSQVRITAGADVLPGRDGKVQDPQQQCGKGKTKLQTRKISRETLYFTVLIEHVPSQYQFGNPLLLLPHSTSNDDQQRHHHHHHIPPQRTSPISIPDLGCPSHERDFLPLWRDIHGKFQRHFWDLALAAVLGIVATRPGVCAGEIARMMRPALGVVEVYCLLEWSLRLGAVRRSGDHDDKSGGGGRDGADKVIITHDGTVGWEVREWWWMALACVAE